MSRNEASGAQYARNLIEATLDPLFTIDKDGLITDVNEAMVNATDKSRELLIGTKFISYFVENLLAHEVFKMVFDLGKVMNYPLTIIDGVLTDVLINGSVYRNDDGNVLGAVIVARDITELKKVEKKLNEAIIFAELATSISEEAKIKAESAAKLAEESVKAKQQFLSNMSHEIRTPMNAIIGFTKVILKTELSAKQREYLTAIKMSGDSLIVLINDILDLAKVDSGKMTFEKTPFKMSISISAMRHLFESKIQEKNLNFIVDYDERIPKVLLGDPVRLHQIILNLISNAVKFTHYGKITLKLELLKEDISTVQIGFSVADTGIGIPADKVGKIFENFQQASSNTSRLYGGTGLGLAIVKQLVEPQGGVIKVESTLDEGSTFSFDLVFEKTSEDVLDESELIDLDAEQKDIRVLVVEDIDLNQLLMKTLLDDFGFESEIVNNGKLAIERIQQVEFDIVLMDLQMPVMNGFEATEYIRNILKLEIPIVALTADVTTSDVIKCKAVGMNDYIAKPVDERLLYSKIIGLAKRKNDEMIKVDNFIDPLNIKCINLDYLFLRTKSNPALMMEMINAYLVQTPPLIEALRHSLRIHDWSMLKSTAHKMIPSFAIMGMNPDFERMARKIQDYAKDQQSETIQFLVSQIEKVCTQACKELKEELIQLKSRLI